MVHAVITLAVCVIMYLLACPWVMFFWPAFFYLGREIAQAEYRYIEAHGGKRSNCPYWCGFIPSAWTLKGLMDWACPMVVSGLMSFAYVKCILI